MDEVPVITVRQTVPGPSAEAVVAEANRLLAEASLHSSDARWLSGSTVDVIITPVAQAHTAVLTVAPRVMPVSTLAPMVVAVRDVRGNVQRIGLGADGRARLPLPDGRYVASLEPAGAIPLERPRRRRPLREVVGVAAAIVAAVALVLGEGPAVAGVDLAKVDCGKTTGRSDDHHVVVAAVWAGNEKARFVDVLEQYEKRSRDQVTFATQSDEANRRLGETLDEFIEKGCPPDVALLPQPGLLRDLAGRGALVPLDGIAGDLISQNYSQAWQDQAKVDGTSYGVWFKAAHKSLIWYDANAFTRAGINDTPKTWDELMDVARRLKAAGVTPFSIAGGDGWTLTDWFENVYLRMWGARKYRELSDHKIPWTDRTVTEALAKLAELFGQPGWFVGGPADAGRFSYEASVANVFPKKGSPKAAMIVGSDYAANEIATSGARVGIDAKYFEFPSVGRPGGASGDMDVPVVGPSTRVSGGDAVGGDVAVMLRDTPAARRFVRFLATPEAALPWVRAGGFSSPNRRVPATEYPGAVSGTLAGLLTQADDVSFDMSDLQRPTFGSDKDRGAWPIFQGFLRDPTRVEAVAQELEEAWRAAQPSSSEGAVRRTASSGRASPSASAR